MDKSIKRIVIIGPESTGKSTLSKALARYYQTLYVPEYARQYLESLDRPYCEEDMVHIARGQIAAEDALARQLTRPLLFCDTDLYVLKVWSESKYGRCSRFILEQIAERRYDFYLLTDIDMPWEDDPLREHPELLWRSYFYRIYLDIVQHSGCPFLCVNGHEEERLVSAVEGVGRFLGF